jgi:hypothetical protein
MLSSSRSHLCSQVPQTRLRLRQYVTSRLSASLNCGARKSLEAGRKILQFVLGKDGHGCDSNLNGVRHPADSFTARRLPLPAMRLPCGISSFTPVQAQSSLGVDAEENLIYQASPPSPPGRISSSRIEHSDSLLHTCIRGPALASQNAVAFFTGCLRLSARTA